VAAVLNGLVCDVDVGVGERQCCATIRSGMSAGLQEPIDLAISKQLVTDQRGAISL